jgi:hypothetical protein
VNRAAPLAGLLQLVTAIGSVAVGASQDQEAGPTMPHAPNPAAAEAPINPMR